MELLIGCGNDRSRRIKLPDRPDNWTQLVTLDIDSGCAPDILCDLDQVGLPFKDNTFDELHAYEVLEHCGRQGDWRFFFAQFDEFARILKPNGVVCITAPSLSSPWIWGDPGHTRYMGSLVYVFLSHKAYTDQVSKTTMTDYRSCFTSDWQVLHAQADPTSGSDVVILRNIKKLANEPTFYRGD